MIWHTCVTPRHRLSVLWNRMCRSVWYGSGWIHTISLPICSWNHVRSGYFRSIASQQIEKPRYIYGTSMSLSFFDLGYEEIYDAEVLKYGLKEPFLGAYKSLVRRRGGKGGDWWKPIQSRIWTSYIPAPILMYDSTISGLYVAENRPDPHLWRGFMWCCFTRVCIFSCLWCSI